MSEYKSRRFLSICCAANNALHVRFSTVVMSVQSSENKFSYFKDLHFPVFLAGRWIYQASSWAFFHRGLEPLTAAPRPVHNDWSINRVLLTPSRIYFLILLQAGTRQYWVVLHHLAHYFTSHIRGFSASNNCRFTTHKLAPLLRNMIWYISNNHTRASTVQWFRPFWRKLN